ncbi:BTAD domain-containing putative transcriptional regulator [Pseudosporangium ferrugineum]|uniref:DNA-binding SARP family transcriptional activator n=1 Tax=Pseudosporangium ferrugineum TaxID=439699 RepID=A0A2T0SFW9_9ACTN|nr:BTAD domain-containing putative transcriptional regulator [Pseudosporangium ferrugineum]PRY32318.1 DNA-binding SARP family transcriptional activator [Pseudosporangium ferrugineum]
MTRTAFQVLGPVGASTGRGPVALRGARQRSVLARLLIARGRVVPVTRLVDDLWERPPDGAVAALRTFVADLRRALEPDRPPRAPASLLVTAGQGYALRPAPGAVDAWRFEAAVASGAASAQTVPLLDEALALWHGPAYSDCATAPWARAEIDRLDELRLLAVERRAAALLALGRAEEAVPGLQAHTGEAPFREDAWHLLATALYRTGRQGEALAALRRARELLAGELGVDPGPRLRRLEQDILAQAPHLTAGVPPAPVPVPGPEVSLFGRDEELSRLLGAARAAQERERPVLALIAGEAGAGKSALAEALTGRLAARGWNTDAVRAPDYEDAPALWNLPTTPEAADPAVARFLRHRDLAARFAAWAPVVLVADDLHRFDADALDLLTHLAAGAGPPRGAVLVVGTYRTGELGPRLTAALARVARAEPVRVHLGGLAEASTAELIASVTGHPADPGAVRALHRRSGGNPFFVRELARLAAAGADLDDIPAGVRDVIRHRLDRLPESARTVLRRAAVLGRDIDPEVLLAIVGDRAIDALDAALRAGFLTETGRDLRFTHVLVRDTLYDDLSTVRRSRWHATAAETIERLRPADPVALAHHYALASGPGTAARAAHYAARAAEQAERRSNPHEAARWWRAALDRTGAGDLRGRLTAMMGLGRALAVTGHLAGTRALRAEAVTAITGLDDPELAATVLTAFDVPAVWPRNDDQALSDRIVALAEDLLPAAPPDLRVRLLTTLALESRGSTDDRGRRAAEEAERTARRSRDPALLALALNARYMHAVHRCGMSAERAAIGAELVALAAGNDLVTYEVLGHLILLQSACATGDFRTADTCAEAADRLAERYDLPVVGIFTQLYAAFRLAAGPARDEESARGTAEATYRTACDRLSAAGMPGVSDGLLGLALLSLDSPGPAEGLGPYEPWARPGLLLARGRRDEAAEALANLPDSPHDLLREARLCLAAAAAAELGDRDIAARLHADLLPAAAELAGAAGGVLSLGPVRDYLTALEALL